MMNIKPDDLKMPKPKQLHLGLPEAIRIASQFELERHENGCGYLELTAYSSMSVDAQARLSCIEAGFASIGLKQLDENMASQLVRWKSYFLIFDKLAKLTPEVARILGASNHALVFSSLKRLDIDAASYLIDSGIRNGVGYPLSVRLPAKLSLPLANVLSRHPHELSLRILSLDVDAAQALSRHQGYWLHVNSNLPFSNDTLQVFSGNANKHMTIGAIGDGYQLEWGVNDDWWTTNSPGAGGKQYELRETGRRACQ